METAMSIKFNADEVFEMGQQIERNGRRFYEKAARLAGDEEVRALLERLAEMEAAHEALFGEMRAAAAGQGLPQTEYDPDFEADLYLRSAADSHVFNVHKDLAETLTGAEAAEEVLTIALGFERDTIVFFLGLKEMVPKGLGKDKIEGLLRAEMSHIVDISSRLRALQQ